MDDDHENPTFDALGLRPELLRALTSLGYEEPTPIQQEAVPPLVAKTINVLPKSRCGEIFSQLCLTLVQESDVCFDLSSEYSLCYLYIILWPSYFAGTIFLE